MRLPWHKRLALKLGLWRPCFHMWRPAVVRHPEPKPARYCGMCEKVETMATPEFYAQFGRMPY